jgi:hypothetical protein
VRWRLLDQVTTWFSNFVWNSLWDYLFFYLFISFLFFFPARVLLAQCFICLYNNEEKRNVSGLTSTMFEKRDLLNKISWLVLKLPRNKTPKSSMEKSSLRDRKSENVWTKSTLISYVKGIVHYEFVPANRSTKHSSLTFWNAFGSAFVEHSRYLAEQVNFVSWQCDLPHSTSDKAIFGRRTLPRVTFVFPKLKISLKSVLKAFRATCRQYWGKFRQVISSEGILEMLERMFKVRIWVCVFINRMYSRASQIRNFG